VPDVVLVGL